MRALLVWPELPHSFWSFPKACRLRGSRAPTPPLGLITVAGLLPDHWDLRLVDLCARPLREEDWNWADIVMVSGMYVQKPGLLAVVQEAKRRGKTVVAGGPYPTTMAEEVADAGCDFVVRGEAESSISLLLEAIEEGKPRVIENGEKPHMALSPLPRFDLLRRTDYTAMAIQTSRGCPFNCEFCDVVRLLGRKPRYKSPEQVIAELDALVNLGFTGHVFIADDNFIGNKTHAREVLERLIPWAESKGKPFTFTTQVSLNLGKDRELIDLMTEACLGEVFVGIESPDEEVLRTSRKFQNIKNPIVESLDNMKNNGMSVIGSFIIGLDGEKTGVGERICTLVERTEMPVVMVNLLQAPPSTSLWQRLKSEGRLREEVGYDMGITSALNFVPLRPEREILEELWNVWSDLYEPRNYLERAYKYYLSMRPTREAQAMKRGEASPYEHVPKLKPDLREQLYGFLAILKILWRFGLRPSYRGQFWGHVIGLARKNPSRLRKYVMACALGTDLFDIRASFLEEIKTMAEVRGLGKLLPGDDLFHGFPTALQSSDDVAGQR